MNTHPAKAPVTVCIPVYNGAAYLHACLESVLVQTHAEIEILIVDDCSTDDSVAIIDAYRRRDARIRYERNDLNLGLVGNWNRCVKLATHDWIKFLFQDDLLMPTCIERLMAYARDPAVLVTCKRDFLFDEGATEQSKAASLLSQRRIDSFFAGGDFATPVECREAALNRFGYNNFGEPTSVLLHKSFFARFGSFRSGMIMACDLEYWIRVSIHTGAFYVSEPLVHFRVHEAAVSAQNHRLREFRTAMLDNLLLLHAFVHEEAYRLLRHQAAVRQLPIDLRAIYADHLHKVFAKADWARRDRSNPDPMPMKELQTFYEEFPAFRRSDIAHRLWRLRLRLRGNAGASAA